MKKLSILLILGFVLFSCCPRGESMYQGECVPDCFKCTAINCDHEINVCQNNKSCMHLALCIDSCYTQSCLQMCIYSYPYAARDLLDYLECGKTTVMTNVIKTLFRQA